MRSQTQRVRGEAWGWWCLVPSGDAEWVAASTRILSAGDHAVHDRWEVDGWGGRGLGVSTWQMEATSGSSARSSGTPPASVSSSVHCCRFSADLRVRVCARARVCVCVCVRTTSQRQHHAGTRVGVRGVVVVVVVVVVCVCVCVCVSVRSLRSARPCVRLRHTTHASRHSAPHCSGRRRNRQAARQGKARRRPELERAACDAQLRRQDRVAVGRVMQVGVRRSHCLL